MQLQFQHSRERLTRRTGLVLVNEFGKRLYLGNRINEAFGAPGSNRGKKASEYIQTLVEMFLDGALHLEDVRSLEADTAYQELTEKRSYPTSDAIGDWLRRHGGREGEYRLWSVIAQLLTLNTETDSTLDIDAAPIEADKGDGTMNYKGIRGYQPLLGIIAENGLVVGSEFRYGNESPQVGLVEFVHQCERNFSERIRFVRSDSAAYNSEFFNDCFACRRLFTVTADQDVAVMAAIANIPEMAWKRGVLADGTLAPWEVAETIHTMENTTQAFRLAVKRTVRRHQTHLFDGLYTYWIVATNVPQNQMDANAVILFHQKRGEMEKTIGELKHHFNLDHLPCGQFDANALYFTTGLLAYNIIQLVKQITLGSPWMKKSIRTLRYRLFHLAARVISHARSLIVRVAGPVESFEMLVDSYFKLRLSPWPPW